MVKADENRLFEPRYAITIAAHHLRMPRSTLHSWVSGQQQFKAVLSPPASGFLSFVNLTEAFVLFAMRRRYRVTMPKIRDAIAYMEKELDVEHPLAFRQFHTDCVDLFIRTAAGEVNVSKRGQTRMTLFKELDRIEWGKERPVALFPIVNHGNAPEGRPIEINPSVAFGAPVLSGTRVPAAIVCGRFYGGESIKALSDDYGLPESTIEAAVRAQSDPIAA